VVDHNPAVTSVSALIGPRSKNAISVGLAESVKSMIDSPPWYQACTRMSRPGTGTNDALWATQFSVSFCGTGNL
jgi:hypothetical protein